MICAFRLRLLSAVGIPEKPNRVVRLLPSSTKTLLHATPPCRRSPPRCHVSAGPGDRLRSPIHHEHPPGEQDTFDRKRGIFMNVFISKQLCLYHIVVNIILSVVVRKHHFPEVPAARFVRRNANSSPTRPTRGHIGI